MSKNWSNNELDILRNNYGKIPISKVKELLPNRSNNSINHKAFRLSIKGSLLLYRAKVNDSFFSEYNPISCYYAGLIAADGNIVQNRGVLRLSQKDKTVLEKFKSIIQYEGNITRTNQRGTSKYFKDKSKYYECFHLRITSKKIVDDLKNNFNITGNKTLTLQPPSNLDEYHSKCFIIGLIDGDGWIGTYLPKQAITPILKCAITGTLDIARWVQEKFNGVGQIRHPLKGYNPNICQYTWSSKAAFNTIKDLVSIKELENIRFPRKWNKINTLNPIRERRY